MLHASAMAQPPTIVCSSLSLAVDVRAVAETLALAIATPVEAEPFEAALAMAGSALGVATTDPPSARALAALGELIGDLPAVALVAPLGPAHHFLADLGAPTVDEIAPLVSLVALKASGAPRPHHASTKALSSVDRARLDVGASERRAGAFDRRPSGLLTLEPPGAPPFVVGWPWDVGRALAALRAAEIEPRGPMPKVESVDHQAVLDVVLGPRRALSDPASKAALEPYDLPLPVEELCGSPSRAAAEAARIGFPVRIALASPELRVSDHPDLVVEGVDHAARVRDVFRQTMALARSRSPEARLLGVTVSAATTAKALLRVQVAQLGPSLAKAEIGFLDPHGAASDDRTFMALPTTAEGIERALRRLRGSALLFGASAGERRHVVSAVGDVLLRLAAFVHDWPDEIESVEICPLALLVGGDVEVREAKVQVTDAFTRSLEQPRAARRR
jgi:hypothetical protein